MIIVRPTPRNNYQATAKTHLDAMPKNLWPPWNNTTKADFNEFVSVWVHLAKRLQMGDWHINVVSPQYDRMHNAHYHWRWNAQARIGLEKTIYRGANADPQYKVLELFRNLKSDKQISIVISKIKAGHPWLVVSEIDQVQFDLSKNNRTMKENIITAFNLTEDFKTQPVGINDGEIDITVITEYFKKDKSDISLWLGALAFILLDDDKKNKSNKLTLK